MVEWTLIIQRECKLITDADLQYLDVNQKKQIYEFIQERFCQISPMGPSSGIGDSVAKKEQVKNLEEYVQIFKKLVC